MYRVKVDIHEKFQARQHPGQEKSARFYTRVESRHYMYMSWWGFHMGTGICPVQGAFGQASTMEIVN